MSFLRSFILTFGVMVLLTGTFISITRSQSTTGLWKVVFTHNTGNDWTLVDILPNGRTIERPTSIIGDLIWSPNNDWVVYTTPRIHLKADLYLARPDGSHRRMLKDDISLFKNIWWSPDSQWVLFNEADEMFTEYNLNRVNIVDGRTENFELGSGVNFTCCSWSTDGEWLLFWLAHTENKQSVIRLRPETSEHYTVLSLSERIPSIRTDYDYMSPSYIERDGWIYFADRHEHSDDPIYRMRPDGTDQQFIHATEMGDGTLWVSPDGQWITFISYEGGKERLERIRIDGTQRETLAERSNQQRGRLTLRHFSEIWSPDGQIILFSIRQLETYYVFQLNVQTGEYQHIYTFTYNPINPHFLPMIVAEWNSNLWIVIGLAVLVVDLRLLTGQ